jgi:hypothetical protein
MVAISESSAKNQDTKAREGLKLRILRSTYY